MRREDLDAERQVMAGQVQSLTRDLDAIVESTELVSTDDEHDPDGSTIAFERAMIASLLDRARQQLADLDGALRRLDEGTYGVCDGCGEPIAGERLDALPAAVNCVACVR